jgi:Tfp pilus assembly protein FimV
MQPVDLELISDYGSPWIPHEKVKAASPAGVRDSLAEQLAEAKIMIEALEAEVAELRAELRLLNSHA